MFSFLETFKSFMVPHDRMVKSLEDRRKIDTKLSKNPLRHITENYTESTKAPVYENPNVASPSEFLGEGYGAPIHWGHEDDKIVEFQILGSISMGDVEFFNRYVGMDADGFCDHTPLTAEEKQKYPQHFFPCFAEVQDVVTAKMVHPLQYLNADQEVFMVCYENVLGMLIFGSSDAEDATRREVGFEDNADQQHYQVQFMRFDKAAIERMDLAPSPGEYYRLMQKTFFPTLRVNFAKYNNE